MLGEAMALGAAIVWAFSVILFKRSEEISPLAINLFKNVIGILLLGVTLCFLPSGIDFDRPAGEWWRLILSGVIGIAVADTVFFAALRRLGAGLLAIVECAYAPFMVLLAILVLGEQMKSEFIVGGVLVVGGILVVTTERSALSTQQLLGSMRSHVGGVLMGVFCVACMAVGVVIIKPLIERGDIVEVSLVRLIAGTTSLWIWILLTRHRKESHRVFLPRRVWRSLIPASVLATYVAMLMWVGAFKYADMSVAAVLNQMATVFIVVLARIFIGEPLTRRRILGGSIAMLGAMLIFFFKEH